MAPDKKRASSERSVGQLWAELQERERKTICNIISRHDTADVIERFTMLVDISHTLYAEKQRSSLPLPPREALNAGRNHISQKTHDPQRPFDGILKRKSDTELALGGICKKNRNNKTIAQQLEELDTARLELANDLQSSISSTVVSAASFPDLNTPDLDWIRRYLDSLAFPWASSVTSGEPKSGVALPRDTFSADKALSANIFDPSIAPGTGVARPLLFGQPGHLDSASFSPNLSLDQTTKECLSSLKTTIESLKATTRMFASCQAVSMPCPKSPENPLMATTSVRDFALEQPSALPSSAPGPSPVNSSTSSLPRQRESKQSRLERLPEAARARLLERRQRRLTMYANSVSRGTQASLHEDGDVHGTQEEKLDPISEKS